MSCELQFSQFFESSIRCIAVSSTGLSLQTGFEACLVALLRRGRQENVVFVYLCVHDKSERTETEQAYKCMLRLI